MQTLAVTSTIKQTETGTVLISHMSDKFLKKFDNIEKNFNYMYIQNTYNLSNTNTYKILRNRVMYMESGTFSS